MAKRKTVRCRKCGHESRGPRGAVFHTCENGKVDSVEVEIAAIAAIAAVQEYCDDEHEHRDCFCDLIIAAIRQATGVRE